MLIWQHVNMLIKIPTCRQGAICERDLCSWPRTWSPARDLRQGAQVIDDHNYSFDDDDEEDDDDDSSHDDDYIYDDDNTQGEAALCLHPHSNHDRQPQRDKQPHLLPPLQWGHEAMAGPN